MLVDVEKLIKSLIVLAHVIHAGAEALGAAQLRPLVDSVAESAE